jgi:hypothetical protein
MGWASRYIQKLRAGEPVSFRPHGQSMTGRIESGQLCTVAPIDPAMLEVGDIVLCKVAGKNDCRAADSLLADIAPPRRSPKFNPSAAPKPAMTSSTGVMTQRPRSGLSLVNREVDASGIDSDRLSTRLDNVPVRQFSVFVAG